MQTSDFRTKTIFRQMMTPRPNNGNWIVGLDIGYSGVKTFSPNSVSCFPSYAAKSKAETRLSIGDEDNSRNILYRDDEGEWEVGAMAQNAISVSDTNAGSLSIYGRSRYYSPMFRVIMRVGIAAGIRSNQYGSLGDKRLKIQTGLPPKYLKSDTEELKNVMSGHHEFSVKFGNGKWEDFSFTLRDDDIDVIDQPEGTLFSVSTDTNLRLLPDAKKYFASRVLIVDPGFGTADFFPMIRRAINRDNCQTYTDLSMKQILKDTADEIYDRYHFEVAVPAIQQFLEEGKIIKKEGRKISKVPFDDILKKHSKDICQKAIDRIMDDYNPPIEFDYLILTAGTGAAWEEDFRNSEYFRDCDTLKIISGNQGDPSLPYIFSNARGYYVYGLNRFR